MNYSFNEKEYTIVRYPQSENKSLKAWNAADEYILKYLDKSKISINRLAIYNDRFGFLSLLLSDKSPNVILDAKSQQKSVERNFNANKIGYDTIKTYSNLETFNEKINFAIIKIPKSIDLFRLYLNQLSKSISKNANVICGFMTKYYTPQMLVIANQYFENVEQSLAWKKSRLLILSNPKQNINDEIVNEIALNEREKINQYYGVFSSKKIDIATQLLIKNLTIRENDSIILDLACGNGIIAYEINKAKNNSEIYLVDDSFLAIESAKLNLVGDNFHFYLSDNLDKYEDNYFDFIVSNPPSHFEFETNIEISLALFKEVKRVLKDDGHFELVANKHLNFKTHLIKIFSDVHVVFENKKFVIYECSN